MSTHSRGRGTPVDYIVGKRGLAVVEVSAVKEEIAKWILEGFSLLSIHKLLTERNRISGAYGYRTFTRAINRVLPGATSCLPKPAFDGHEPESLHADDDACSVNRSDALMPFAFEDALVRVSRDEHDEIWFVAKDVCRVLELRNVTEALRALGDDERGSEILNTQGGLQEMVTISESGLYALIFRSRKPQAKAFRKWVTSTVLPAIRKTGRYSGQFDGPPQDNPFADLTGRVSTELASPPLPQSAYVQILSCAVEAAKLEKAGADLIERYFERYCRMVLRECDGDCPKQNGQE